MNSVQFILWAKPSGIGDKMNTAIESFALDYQSHMFTNSIAVHADCFEWLSRIPKASLHAIVTDPPYGVKEYNFDQIEKRENGNGGIWRIPPSFDGSNRSPLPRFTALTPKEREILYRLFFEWSKLAMRVLRPGGHVFIASNAFLSQLVFSALVAGGLEFRGELIRLVRTFRGGDRPKNAENEFTDVCSLPRSCYEPWGILRKPLPSGMTVSDCLRGFGTGGLRRVSSERPFSDVVISERTPLREREIAKHPSLKPQSSLRNCLKSKGRRSQVEISCSCEQTTLSNRFERQPVGLYQGTNPTSESRRTTTQSGYAFGRQRHPIRRGRRYPMADVAERVSELEKRLPLLSPLAQRWHVAAYP
jgi:site-specific DNA-methyltransferase (adenine-specific)